MKTIKILIFLCTIALLPGHIFAASFGDIRLSYLSGYVQINSDTTSDWVPASFNVPLYEGDRIWVPDNGKAELHFRKGTAIRLNERTSADILSYDRDLLQLHVNLGAIFVNYKNNSRIIQINTPVATIRSYDRAIFRIDVQNNGYTYVSVYRGTVYADYRDGRNVIDEGTMLLIRGYSREEAVPLGSPDAWTRWNFDRDRILYDDYRSTRYLPDELRYYSYDLDRHGKWVYVKDYGYCWTPTVIVATGWAPYRHGKWTWIRGDYVWVSYEPWGWVPYHYGRWAFSVSIGWFWVPPPRGAVYWGPGYVAWVHTPSYVSWVPLAPGETYYGYGNYGPHSVNIINININKVVIKDKHRNAMIKDGFTVVHRDTFVTGKQEKIIVKENPFLKENISVGRPGIAPEKRTAMPVIKDLPREKLPPRDVKDVDIRTLKEKFPGQRERDAQMHERMIAPREQQERMRERAPADIRKDSVQPPRIQDSKPDTRRERTREIMPQDVTPDKGRQVTPQQERQGKDVDRQPKQTEKDAQGEKKHNIEENHMRERGGFQERIR